jgi:hypothetical protein
LVLGDYGNDHTQPAIFHLRSDKNSPEDIYRVTFDVAKVKDRTRHHFTFPVQAGSTGQSYFFYIEAPTAMPAKTITVRGAYDQPVNRYGQGSAYVGQPGAWQELSADFAFRAHCDANLLEITNQAFQKLATDIGGSKTGYWGILIIHLGLSLVALFKLQKLTNSFDLIS